jgi:Fe-S cluster assembly protein SufD
MKPMSAEIRPMKTAAEQMLTRAFAGAKAKLPGKGAIEARRAAAFRHFEETGLPHRRVEAWKYTDLRALMREAKDLAEPPDAAAKARADAAGQAFAGIGARRLVFVNGAFVAAQSDVSQLEPGLKIASLGEALARGVPEVVSRLSGTGLADGDLAFSLNTSFMGDGAVIEVDAGVIIARPIHLVFVYDGDQAAAVFTRSLVLIGAGAQLTLLESYEGPDALDYQTNTAIDISVGDGAMLDHVKIGCEGRQALHVSTLTATIGKDAEFRDAAFSGGGAVVRNQLFLCCSGSGAILDLRGASLLGGTQHADTTLVLDHAAGGTKSRELYKSVLDGSSRSVFQGKIIVRPGAQQTDARMMTQALLLSETAEADAKPELEIFADDVQCGHGATTGALDDMLKFYLMARGIPADEAEALLIQAFLGEVIDGIKREDVREAVTSLMFAKPATRG